MIFFFSFSEGFSTIYHQAQTHLSSPSHDCSTSSSALSVDVGFHGAVTSVSIRWNCTHTRLCTFFPLVGIKIMGYLISWTANTPSWTDFGYICPLSGSLTFHCTFRCKVPSGWLLYIFSSHQSCTLFPKFARKYRRRQYHRTRLPCIRAPSLATGVLKR